VTGPRTHPTSGIGCQTCRSLSSHRVQDSIYARTRTGHRSCPCCYAPAQSEPVPEPHLLICVPSQKWYNAPMHSLDRGDPPSREVWLGTSLRILVTFLGLLALATLNRCSLPTVPLNQPTATPAGELQGSLPDLRILCIAAEPERHGASDDGSSPPGISEWPRNASATVAGPLSPSTCSPSSTTPLSPKVDTSSLPRPVSVVGLNLD
jgi:hypothetical protein